MVKDSSITFPSVIWPWVVYMQSGVVLTFISWSRKAFCIQVWVLAAHSCVTSGCSSSPAPGCLALLLLCRGTRLGALPPTPSLLRDQLSALLQFVLLASGQQECSCNWGVIQRLIFLGCLEFLSLESSCNILPLQAVWKGEL